MKVRHLVECIAAVATLAACSASGDRIAPPGMALPTVIGHGAGASHLDASIKAELYVADLAGGVVDIFARKNAKEIMIGQLVDINTPEGLAADAAGNLYIANTSSANVLVYPPGQTQPILTLQDSGWYPVAVAVSEHKVVAVANSEGFANQPGNIAFYRHGATMPFKTVTPTFSSQIDGVSFDDVGNVYFDGTENGTTRVGEIKVGSKKAINLELSGVVTPGTIEVDKSANLLILDKGAATVYVYAPGAKTPTSAIPIGVPHANVPYAFVLSHAEGALFDADENTGYAYRYTYPGGQLTDEIYIGGLPYGVAVTPWARP